MIGAPNYVSDAAMLCVGDEMNQLEALEGQWRAAQDKFKHKRQTVRQVEEDMQVL